MASPAGVPRKACPWKQGCLLQALQCSGGVCVFQYLLVTEKGQLACSFVQCFHGRRGLEKRSKQALPTFGVLPEVEGFPPSFLFKFFFLPLRLLVCLFDCPCSGKACKRGARSTLLGLRQALRQREQQQQRGTMRLRRRGGGSDARASLVAAFSSLVRAFWQQQQLPCSPAA